jgi:hypothetical protein
LPKQEAGLRRLGAEGLGIIEKFVAVSRSVWHNVTRFRIARAKISFASSRLRRLSTRDGWVKRAVDQVVHAATFGVEGEPIELNALRRAADDELTRSVAVSSDQLGAKGSELGFVFVVEKRDRLIWLEAVPPAPWPAGERRRSPCLDACLGGP